MYTEEQYKEAGRKAIAAGNPAAAEEIFQHYKANYQPSKIEQATTDLINSPEMQSAVKPSYQEATKPKLSLPPSNWSVARNAVVKGVASIPDSIINTPTNLYNLGKAAVGTGLAMAGRPDLSPDLTESPNLVHSGLSAIGSIRPEDEPVTSGQRMLDAGVQGATGMFITGKPTFTGAAIGGLSGAVGQGVGEATGSDLAGMAAGIATGGLGAKTTQGAVGAGRWLGEKLESPESLAARKIIAESRLTPEQLQSQLGSDYQGAVINPLTGEVTAKTVPQIMQNAGVSQLARGAQTAGSSALNDVEQANNAIRLAAIEGIAPTAQTLNEAATIAGDSIGSSSKAGRKAAMGQSGKNYANVDANKDIRIMLPVSELNNISKKYYGNVGDEVLSQHIGDAKRLSTGEEVVSTTPEANSLGILPRDSEGKVISATDKKIETTIPVSWDDFKNIRENLGNDIQSAKSGANPNAKRAAALTQMKKTIDDTMDRVSSGKLHEGESFTPENLASYNDANAYHRNMKRQYEEGQQQGIFRTSGDNQDRIQGAELPPKFFNSSPSQVTDMQSFNRLINGDNGLAGQLRSYATTKGVKLDAQGNLSKAAFDKFMDSHSGAIKELFPDADRNTLNAIRDELHNVSKAKGLNRVEGSDTAQKSMSANALSRGAQAAGRLSGIPGIHLLSDIVHAGLAQGKQEQAHTIGNLLANPAFLNEQLPKIIAKSNREIYGGKDFASQSMLVPAVQQSSSALTRNRK